MRLLERNLEPFRTEIGLILGGFLGSDVVWPPIVEAGPIQQLIVAGFWAKIEPTEGHVGSQKSAKNVNKCVFGGIQEAVQDKSEF